MKFPITQLFVVGFVIEAQVRPWEFQIFPCKTYKEVLTCIRRVQFRGRWAFGPEGNPEDLWRWRSIPSSGARREACATFRMSRPQLSRPAPIKEEEKKPWNHNDGQFLHRKRESPPRSLSFGYQSDWKFLQGQQELFAWEWVGSQDRKIRFHYTFSADKVASHANRESSHQLLRWREWKYGRSQSLTHFLSASPLPTRKSLCCLRQNKKRKGHWRHARRAFCGSWTHWARDNNLIINIKKADDPSR